MLAFIMVFNGPVLNAQNIEKLTNLKVLQLIESPQLKDLDDQDIKPLRRRCYNFLEHYYLTQDSLKVIRLFNFLGPQFYADSTGVYLTKTSGITVLDFDMPKLTGLEVAVKLKLKQLF